MPDRGLAVLRCEWCGRRRAFVGESPDRVFCRQPGCALAQQLLELVLEEEGSPEPRVAWCVRAWDELERLTRLIGRGPQVSVVSGQLSLRVPW